MSAKLFVLSGKALGTIFSLQEAAILGRGKDAGVRLADASVSRLHARIEPEGDGWRVTDLDSSNGIWVAGQRVQTALLKDLDEFRVGALELRIRIGADNGGEVAPIPVESVKPDDVEAGESASEPEAPAESASDAPIFDAGSSTPIEASGTLELDRATFSRIHQPTGLFNGCEFCRQSRAFQLRPRSCAPHPAACGGRSFGGPVLL